MNIPDQFKVLIITLSDRAFRKEYEDLSGPKAKEIMTTFFSTTGWSSEIRCELLPDDSQALNKILVEASDTYNIIITTGGTGIGPHDITIETVKPLLSKEISGIMDFIRMKYGADKPNALLSRSVAGIIGNALIYTLPGSVRAVEEYMNEILKTLKHTIYMQYGVDKHS
jgi:molybdenum cofactor synthesis domain-containing protein